MSHLKIDVLMISQVNPAANAAAQSSLAEASRSWLTHEVEPAWLIIPFVTGLAAALALCWWWQSLVTCVDTVLSHGK